MVVFKLIWPQATCCEFIAFIANESNDARTLLEKDVSKALRKLGHTMKVTSTFAYHAFTEHNLNCCHIYWTHPWPVGIHGRLLIDTDKFGLHLDSAKRKYGSSPWGLKICKPGKYDMGKFILTITLTMESGDPQISVDVIGLVSNPHVWPHVTTEPGTSAIAYCAFVEHVLNTYNAIANPAFQRTLIHHNLM
jgi:hypothetical protein